MSKLFQSALGFTLMEVLIVTVLFAIFMGAVYETSIVGLRAANSADEREDLRTQMTRALDQMTREMASSYNVDVAQDQRFQFDARDIDGDGSNDTNINYVVTSGDLLRGSTLLIRDLSSLDFDYVDADGDSMSTPVASGDRDEVRVVQITMTAVKDQETISLTAAAYLRNM
ncbi:MAG: prepilin-type N-terminal cleavage/methylation domain-containing protein [Candidatus Omnitrophica bacterium]|nr:prepilin-type N-terminal cleavage/methylation domain-containing protein [Candidatus Omnitrophota bacterium]